MKLETSPIVEPEYTGTTKANTTWLSEMLYIPKRRNRLLFIKHYTERKNCGYVQHACGMK